MVFENNSDNSIEKEKDLNTYVENICYNTFAVYYQELRVDVTQAAMRELIYYEKTLDDVLEILHNGDYAPRKRKEGTIEKWLGKGNKTFNVVIVKDYHVTLKEDVWLLIHFGKFTKRKKS